MEIPQVIKARNVTGSHDVWDGERWMRVQWIENDHGDTGTRLIFHFDGFGASEPVKRSAKVLVR